MIRRPPRSTLSSSSAASDVYKRQVIVPVFKLAKLAQLYTERLTQLGIVLTSRLNTTRLKKGCCHIFPICVLTAQQCGKHVLLVFDEHIGESLSAACQQSCDEDAQLKQLKLCGATYLINLTN